jgi:Domain of unknown function (DUF6265)
MRRTVSGLIMCLMLPCLVLTQAQRGAVEGAGWLAGCWQGVSGGREVNEQWMKPAGGEMLGMSRTVSKGKVTDYEFMRIRREDDGELYFIARPARQPEASFKLVKSGPRELMFENPQHDFPQRIIYRLEGDGSLTARIEGTSQGKERGFDYPLKRVACD